eukprot:g37677.t1
MAAGFAELCAASAKAQATSEALERSHRKLNPELDPAQRLELLERFSGSLFCCPDHATEGFCPVGRIQALECMRDLAVHVFPARPAVLLAMPLQSVEQAVPKALPCRGAERWLRQYNELRQVFRFLGDGCWLRQNCARTSSQNEGPLRDDTFLWKAARTFLQELGELVPRSLPALRLPQFADVLRWAEAQFVAKLHSCSEECLRSAAVLGQAASLQELYLSKACSPEDLCTGAQLRPSTGCPGSHALHVLCL